MPLTEQETEFYERLANMEHWRERCAYCGCPKWAHDQIVARQLAGAVAGVAITTLSNDRQGIITISKPASQ